MQNNQLKDRGGRPAVGNRDETQASMQSPSITLPKGGGAIRGMGEKFAANPVTGTGSMSVPIAVSPGRSGLGPQLTLTYNSGAGNGPFGFGWQLSLPAITRKTDKGLPRYRDAEASDVFLLSGAEDLVPVLESGGAAFEDGITYPDYTIHRYRPRIEGLFARIERWTRQSDGDVHWRSISRDNILTIYGEDVESRIADPQDPTRIFSWLICETRDDRGNAVIYRYKAEDGTGVDLVRACEQNRGDRDDPRRTVNRYLKQIRYGNRTPLLDDAGRRPLVLSQTQIEDAGWMFEVVFDYGEHDTDVPTPDDPGPWDYRADPFSSYRAGFEVRTTRLCQRVLMFHHFPDEAGVGSDCLVRATEFTYSHEQDPENARNPVYTFLHTVTQTGWRRDGDGYLKRSLPPVEFEYTLPVVQDLVEDVNPESLENLPVGVDGATYQWTDLHGEGIPGILTEQGGAWFYKRNFSPMDGQTVELAPMERVAVQPNLTLAGGAQFIDLAGDGQPDLVVMDGPEPGLYEHDNDEVWQHFRPFQHRLNRNTRDPNLKFVDLDGDGHSDVLITEDDALVWHASLAEEGFGPAQRVSKALDEEKGPRLVFADGEQSVYLGDFSGDGLTDIVRIRNGDVCYWPNLGYARFGAKVTMDHGPLFDTLDQFDPRRLRLADIDGTGTTDIIYLHRYGVRLYFNQSGNGWSEPRVLGIFPRVDDMVHIQATDLLGNGTACLVWSSPAPGDAPRVMRYINLMGGQKPHLLVKTVNNLGAETRVHYAPSTKFYLQDKHARKPWITRLPFPVHVVERVETFDHISRNRFVTRYAYHHGYFDGEEREFRGFGMVEQWDTEEMAALSGGVHPYPAGNIDDASDVPPVHTKTWFHTGVFLDREHISRQYEREYYREPGLTDDEFRMLLLPDTTLPPGLTIKEDREACRALKGMMLRQEVYADDAGPDTSEGAIQRAKTPYTVVEQDFTIRPLQRRGSNRHGVFLTHPHEAITFHYEREPADPRIQQALTLEVDKFGNVLKSAAIGYGRHEPDLALPTDEDRKKQTATLIAYTENRVTNAIEETHTYRIPLPCEALTFELTGYTPSGPADRYQATDFVEVDPANPGRLRHRYTDEVPYEADATTNPCRRTIEQLRTLYRPDDCGESHNDSLRLLPLGELEPLALPGESYKLAFTPGLLTQVFQREGEPLMPDPATVLGGQGDDQGGYVDLDGDGHWWIPSGRSFFTTNPSDSPAAELAEAQQHFFLPRRTRDPFGQTNTVDYDDYDLLMRETRDALDNRVTVGEREHVLPDGTVIPAKPGNNYRVLQPWLVTGLNGNRTQVAFDALGMVVGTAVMGKPEETLGDSLDGFVADLTESDIIVHLADPLNDPHAILGRASTRLVYDLFVYKRTRNDPAPQPAVVCTLARETHDADLAPGEQTRIQLAFSYTDGFGHEIQKKIQAEPETVNGLVGPPRWVGSGWTIFNNKGQTVRQYEPFFSSSNRFEFGMQVGVSPILFYDPLGRVIATLHPNHTYEKVVFGPWHQATWDVNDTVLADPRTDPDTHGYVKAYFNTQPADWDTWHGQRQDGLLGSQEKTVAAKAAAHADTPTVAYFDTLGRPYLTAAHNKVDCENHDLDGTDEKFHTRVELDIEGNQREVVDAKGRIVMVYDYDMLGSRIHQISMEAGERWMLGDVTGSPIRAWDSRNHAFRHAYDILRRSLRTYVVGADPDRPDRELLTDRLVYGEQHPDAAQMNLLGRLYLQLDQAGAVASEAHDFKRNLVRASRRLTLQYKDAVDWRVVDTVVPADAATEIDSTLLDIVLASQLEAEVYTSRTNFDALNRSVSLTTPHTADMKPSVIRPGYNEAGLLDRMEVMLRGASDNGRPVWTPFVTNIDYDAKGQRKRIDYGNGASTFYDYDPLTFRLVRLLTRRDAVVFPDDCPQPPPAGWPGCQVQDLHYTYDPAGNITHIQDNAQQKIFFRNKRVDPDNDYTYDGLYRLIQATGREHLGQNGQPAPHSPDDADRTGRPHPNDGNAMDRYCEKYVYDAVGNFLEMSHHRSCPQSPSWTRSYTYVETSLIEDGTGGTPINVSNRLSSTTLGGGNGVTEPYAYDAHGNMTAMPHLSVMRWDYRDQLQATARQAVTHGGTPETTYYVYDAAGQRVRKMTERYAPAGETPTRKEERIYLGGFEIYRSYGNDGETVALERETLHTTDDRQRIALVETRVQGNDPAPQQLIRYQFGNHLGSAALELEGQAQVISYEEFTPYGNSSYQADHNNYEVPKRYRYTGKEHDEESGFYYHGARYFAPWVGMWTSVDPAEFADGINLYLFTKNNPVRFFDLTGKGSEEQQLGKKNEDRWENQQEGANERRKAKGNKPVDYTIGDKTKAFGKKGEKGSKEPDDVKGKKTVIEHKATHTSSEKNQVKSKRRTFIKATLEQNKEQVKKGLATGQLRPDARGRAVFTIWDSDKGQSSEKLKAKYQSEIKEVYEEWVSEADTPEERDMRRRIKPVVTTNDKLSKIMKAPRGHTTLGAKAGLIVTSVMIVPEVGNFLFDYEDAAERDRHQGSTKNVDNLLIRTGSGYLGGSVGSGTAVALVVASGVLVGLSPVMVFAGFFAAAYLGGSGGGFLAGTLGEHAIQKRDEHEERMASDPEYRKATVERQEAETKMFEHY